ncbi:type II secretion system protein GspM [uncultured Xylophilus sp.]|uniref:type II secretion system protein GspM n=1 Tax=uncultured Xylophilus sp. TaxID=296832 RepID=UPI0025FF4DEA|nr:type II secretion system protein GspM [uncultured Xylophilus sp.]
MPAWKESAAAARLRWQALSPRERYLSGLAAVAVGLLLVWAIALAPALRTLAGAETRRNTLDAQQQRLLVLQAEARRLQAEPRANPDDALRALQASVAQLGAGAQLSASGDRAILTLRGTPPDRLAAWLAQARANARALPVEARLTRSPPRTAAAAGATGGSAGARLPNPVAAQAGPTPDFSQNIPFPASPSGAVPVTAAADTDVRWDGTLVLALPPR